MVSVLKGKSVYLIVQELSYNFIFGISEFKSLTKEICKLPSFFSVVLFGKIDANDTGYVTR